MVGWAICIAHGRVFFGRRGLVERDLSPVFALDSGVALQQGPQGTQLARPCMCTPVLGLPSIKALTMPADAIWIDMSELSRDDQAALANARHLGEQMVQQMRAAESGIAIASDATLKVMRRGRQ